MLPQWQNEDSALFYNQIVCAKCLHRFSTLEDCQVHIAIVHEKQPKGSDIMDMLEIILTTVSRDDKKHKDIGGSQSNPNPAPKDPIA